MKTAYFNRFTLDLPDQCVADCSHQGQCDEDVEFWFRKLDISAFPSAENVRAELREYGAWNRDELSHDDQNLRRLIWVAACNIRDEEREAAKEPAENPNAGVVAAYPTGRWSK